MHLVQAAGGRSRAAPYGSPGIWCNEEDATAWWVQVQTVAQMVTDASRSIEPKDVPPELSAYKSGLAKLEEPSKFMAFGLGGCGEAVASYIASIEHGACMLDLLAAAGATTMAPDIGPPPAAWFDQFTGGAGSVLAGAGLLFLAYLAFQNRD